MILRWSVGEGWRAPPLPADLASTMSTEDLKQALTEDLQEKEKQIDDLPLTNYTLGDVLRENRWSVSRSCRHKDTGKEYEVKIIPKKDRVNERVIGVLRYLKHPHLIRVYDAIETEEAYYVVHEPTTGTTLAEGLYNAGRYGENTAAVYIKQLLQALEHLHSNEMVHHDVTPENLYLNADNQAVHLKLSECSTAVFNHHDLITIICLQRPQFLGPEVLLDKSTGKQADMWAVGVVSFLMLTGGMPFCDPRGDQYIYDHILKANICPDDDWNIMSHSARDFICKLLTIDSDARLSVEQALCHPWITN